MKDTYMKNKWKFINWRPFARTVIEFSVNDFKKRYSGSALGAAWAYIQTVMTVVIY